jgi:acetyl esterase/lipase
MDNSTRVLHDADLGVPCLPLWDGPTPYARGNDEDDLPTLALFLPATAATGSGVIICPGGGYGFLANDHEGVQVARWFNRRGVAAFVLHYRHAPGYRHPVPMHDAQRAMRLVRHHRDSWNVQPERLGIMGFSAGGHLAATVATQGAEGDPDADDPVERWHSRPAFCILGYPVIGLSPRFGHLGSCANLLGPEASPTRIDALSAERRVTPDTPPAFLFHTSDDEGVAATNSVEFYLALRRAGVAAELHVFAHGPHGVGLCLDDPVLGVWPALLDNWLRRLGVC